MKQVAQPFQYARGKAIAISDAIASKTVRGFVFQTRKSYSGAYSGVRTRGRMPPAEAGASG